MLSCSSFAIETSDAELGNTTYCSHNDMKQNIREHFYRVPNYRASFLLLQLSLHRISLMLWRSQASAAKGDVRVLASCSPLSQAKSRLKLTATAVAICCKLVFAKPI